MMLLEWLFEDLKRLRTGPGLTEARLRQRPVLLEYLGGRTASESRARLVALVEEIEDTEQRAAVKAAYGLVGGTTLQVQERRKVARRAMRMSERTLIRRELAGLQDVAHRIVEAADAAIDDHGLGTAEELWQLRRALEDG